jgi:hypothetical protein
MQSVFSTVGAIAAGISFKLGKIPAQAATLTGSDVTDVTSVNVSLPIDHPNAAIGGITYNWLGFESPYNCL